MSGFKAGDRVRVVGNTVIVHHFDIGEEVEIENVIDSDRYGARAVRKDRDHFQIVYIDDLELLEEYDTMAHNNGDLIKVATDKDQYGSPQYTLFVKFGEFYYDLSKGGQMRGAKNIPKPARGMPKNEKIGNMSGTGDYMLGAGVKADDPNVPEGVADDDCPFDEDSEIEGLLGPTAAPLTATDVTDSFEQWEKDHAETLKALREFQKAFDGSGFAITGRS